MGMKKTKNLSSLEIFGNKTKKKGRYKKKRNKHDDSKKYRGQGR
jgi:hypothetical protein